MAATFTAIIPFSAVLAFAALASCGGDRGSGRNDAKDKTAAQIAQAPQLLPEDFKGVCSGALVSAARAYDSKAQAHKALYFATYKDDLMDRSDLLPDDWTVQFAAERDALKAIDLVACSRRTAARQLKVCDGYKKDGKITENKVRWHAATYELSVREARTGRKLAETTIETTDSDCPWFMDFDGDAETVDDYARLSDSAVADFLRPYITR